MKLKPESKPKSLSRTKHDNVAPADLRIHKVAVRLSGNEFAELNLHCGGHNLNRAELIRTMIFDRSSLPIPVIIPPVNLELARILGCAFGNLSTIATAMRQGGYANFDEIARLVSDVQNRLKGLL